MRRFTEWLSWKWRRWTPEDDLPGAYLATFSTPQGRLVLQHWMDNVYCTVYEGTDERQLWMHNARRAFVHEILELIDRAEHQDKYEVKVESA